MLQLIAKISALYIDRRERTPRSTARARCKINLTVDTSRHAEGCDAQRNILTVFSKRISTGAVDLSDSSYPRADFALLQPDIRMSLCNSSPRVLYAVCRILCDWNFHLFFLPPSPPLPSPTATQFRSLTPCRLFSVPPPPSLRSTNPTSRVTAPPSVAFSFIFEKAGSVLSLLINHLATVLRARARARTELCARVCSVVLLNISSPGSLFLCLSRAKNFRVRAPGRGTACDVRKSKWGKLRWKFRRDARLKRRIP